MHICSFAAGAGIRPGPAGFGAAGIMSQNGALVRFTYPSKMLGRGLGLNALVASAGAALGPTVASGILGMLFAVNVPIGIGAYL